MTTIESSPSFYPTPPPATSRAWTFTARGPPSEVLSLTDGRPTPSLPPPLSAKKRDEEWILVKTAYAALNPAGIFHISLLPAAARAKTSVPEMDLAGTVVDVWTPAASDPPSRREESRDPGPGQRFKKGDRVAAFLPVEYTWSSGEGALAEYVSLPARYAVPVPEGVGLREASGLLLAGLSAKELVAPAGLKEGGRVLVNAAAGGIGSYAVQMARNIVGRDGFVVGVCSARGVEVVKGLGADEVIDYTTAPLHESLISRFPSEPFDAILDAIGTQSLYKNCSSYLTGSGTYVAIGLKPTSHTLLSYISSFLMMQVNALWPRSPLLGGTGRTWKAVAMMAAEVSDMEDLMGMLERGELKTVVDSEWSFEDALKAYEAMGSGKAKGKVVVKVGK